MFLLLCHCFSQANAEEVNATFVKGQKLIRNILTASVYGMLRYTSTCDMDDDTVGAGRLSDLRMQDFYSVLGVW